MNLSLYDIDVERLKQVRSGELWGRGCGKTIEKMVTMLSHIQPYNDGKQYLFIGENEWHTRDIYRTFVHWIEETGIYCNYSPNRLMCDAKYSPPPKPTTFLGKVKAFFNKPEDPPNIRFHFTTPGRLYPWGIRGMRYNRIIVDLTAETYYKNQQTIEEALFAECP